MILTHEISPVWQKIHTFQMHGFRMHIILSTVLPSVCMKLECWFLEVNANQTYGLTCLCWMCFFSFLSASCAFHNQTSNHWSLSGCWQKTIWLSDNVTVCHWELTERQNAMASGSNMHNGLVFSMRSGDKVVHLSAKILGIRGWSVGGGRNNRLWPI